MSLYSLISVYAVNSSQSFRNKDCKTMEQLKQENQRLNRMVKELQQQCRRKDETKAEAQREIKRLRTKMDKLQSNGDDIPEHHKEKKIEQLLRLVHDKNYNICIRDEENNKLRSQAIEPYQDGHYDGYEKGHDAGYWDGYKQGRDAGYYDGYDQGYQNAKEKYDGKIKIKNKFYADFYEKIRNESNHPGPEDRVNFTVSYVMDFKLCLLLEAAGREYLCYREKLDRNGKRQKKSVTGLITQCERECLISRDDAIYLREFVDDVRNAMTHYLWDKCKILSIDLIQQYMDVVYVIIDGIDKTINDLNKYKST